jgi:hypothetical protein
MLYFMHFFIFFSQGMNKGVIKQLEIPVLQNDAKVKAMSYDF